MRVLDLFSGIGGISLGLERAGMETVGFCEVEPFCRQVLAKHWPGVPCHHDINTLDGALYRGVDLVCGGFPCQDISLAGKGAGLSGGRSGLFYELARVISEARPRWALLENVSALRSRGLESVLGVLSALGYDAEWHCVPAAAVGAPHRRDRVWVVANASGQRMEGSVLTRGVSSPGPWGWRGEEDLRLVAADPFRGGVGHPQPLLRRVDDGIPGCVDRLRALGNAVVPQVVEMFGRAIMEADRC